MGLKSVLKRTTVFASTKWLHRPQGETWGSWFSRFGLRNLSRKEKELLGTPVVPCGLFRAAVPAMQKRFKEKEY